MKIRSNYVSNSSSSSYIIVYDEDASIKMKDFEWSVQDLIDYIENISHDWSSECTQIKAIGKESSIEFIKDRWSDDEYSREIIKKIEKSKKNGAAILNISYHDPVTKKLFDWLKNRKKIKLITEEEA